MEDEGLKEYVQKQLHKKGIDIKTQDYITDYIHMNKKLFGNTLNVNKIVDRILNNLGSSIKTFNNEKNISMRERIFMNGHYAGLYSADDKKILINPIRHIKSYVLKSAEKREKSTIMHEIDHAATTSQVDVSEKEKDNYISSAIERHHIVDSKKRERIVSKLNDRYEKNDKKVFISGIDDPRAITDQGISLKGLNEGITAYKQELYDNFNGIKPKTGYRQEKKLAIQIANVIGKEALISKQFDGDYEGIRQMFNERTGQDLNYLVKELNSMTKFRDPISRAIYKITRKIRNHNDIEVLSPANNNTNNVGEQNETLQKQLEKQVNTPKEILKKDVEDITTQTSERTLSQHELKKEVDVSMVK